MSIEILTPRVAFITAIYGGYEKTCKAFTPQNIPCDFICFTDNPEIETNGWTLDTNPYHFTHPSPIDTGEYLNSLKNNAHSRNVGKFYKLNFYNIPRLADYDLIIWVDGTIKIIHENCAAYFLKTLKADEPIALWENEMLDGSMLTELKISLKDERFSSTRFFDQAQPFQDLQKQYDTYISEGYTDAFWKVINPSLHYGFWCAAFVGFNMRSHKIRAFLDRWYLQILMHSTKDQMGLSYALWKENIIPYTLPDHAVKGGVHSVTDFHIKGKKHGE